MIRARRSATYLLVTIACFVEINCHLRRPNTTPSRMIEPQILDPQMPEVGTQVVKAPDAISIRLLDTQARGHIGRRLLHLRANGELTEDAVWKWHRLLTGIWTRLYAWKPHRVPMCDS